VKPGRHDPQRDGHRGPRRDLEPLAVGGDLFRPDSYALLVASIGKDGIAENPTGPDKSLDPRNPNAPVSRVQRGGSFLCSDVYCKGYRPSARGKGALDTGLSHVGFRCVRSK